MITSKHARCQRWCWQYISKRPHALTREIAGATADYTAMEITRALAALVGLGYVEVDAGSAGRGWVACVPCVVVGR